MATLQSTFTPDPEPSTQGHTVSHSNTITFNWTVCTINGETGCYSLTESSDVETGLIEQATLFLSAADQGKTKDVYSVSHFSHRLHFLSFRWVPVGHRWAGICGEKTCGHQHNVDVDDALSYCEIVSQ